MADLTTPTVFGRSLLLGDGDLVLDSGDFLPVTGRENLFQGIQAMIHTPFASDIFNATYGFDLLNCLAAPQAPAVVRELIKLNIVKSLTTDSRIHQIKEIVFDDEPRFYELNPGSDPEQNRNLRQSSRRWQAIVVAQTAQEASVAIKIQGLRL